MSVGKNRHIKREYLSYHYSIRKAFREWEIKKVVAFLNGKIDAADLNCNVKTREEGLEYIFQWNMKVREVYNIWLKYNKAIDLPLIEHFFVKYGNQETIEEENNKATF